MFFYPLAWSKIVDTIQPIQLTLFETLVPASLLNEESEILSSKKKTYVGHLKDTGGPEGKNKVNVYAITCGANYYRLYACFGTIGNPIPIYIKCFRDLRRWCKFVLEHPGLSQEAMGRRFLEAEELTTVK